MKLDDYEEFDNEKPDEEFADDGERENLKTSRSTRVLLTAVFAAALALVGGAVAFSFHKDDEDLAKDAGLSPNVISVQGSKTENPEPVPIPIEESKETEEKEAPEEKKDTTENEIKTDFLPDTSRVTAKEEVNLRSLPSTTDENCVILGTLSKGEVLQRNGISYEMGWSRLEYNGQTVYAVTSYLEVVK